MGNFFLFFFVDSKKRLTFAYRNNKTNKIMKVLSSNYTPQYCVEYVSYNEMKFKIYSECFCCTDYKFGIEIFTKNFGLERIAFWTSSNDGPKDIEGIVKTFSYDSNEERLKTAKENIELGKEWIKRIFEEIS